MRTQHKTLNGKALEIVSMEDTHITNTINSLLRRLRECSGMIVSGSKIDRIVNNTKQDVSIAEDYIENFRDIVAPYILEAVFRGIDLNFYTKEMQSILGRVGKKDCLSNFFNDLEDEMLIIDSNKSCI